MDTFNFGARGYFGAKLGVVTALVACAGCTAGQGGEPTTGGTTTPPTITSDDVTVTIQGTAQASGGGTLAGVAVCLRPDPTTADRETCTTSDDHGAWKFTGAPSNAWIGVTFVKDGFFPTLRAIETDTTDIAIAPTDGELVTSSAMPAMLDAAIDPASGHFLFATAAPGLEAATAATVTVGTIGGPTTVPAYFDANGDPVLGASGGAEGAMANLPPGYYEVTFQGADVSCVNAGQTYGYPITTYQADGVARLLVPVVAGFLTAPVAVTCTSTTGQ
jgi:hypothetical protein